MFLEQRLERKPTKKWKVDNMTWKEILKAPRKATPKQIKKKILSAKTKQGGALAMKDLKDIASQEDLDKALAELIKEGKMFRHKDGDLYTHEPSSRSRGPFTA